MSEREPQPLSVTPQTGGARPPLGSGGPSRSENDDDSYDDVREALCAAFPGLTRAEVAHLIDLARALNDYRPA